jgi:hypothetical protein
LLTQLRNISPAQLSSYASSAFLTVGSVEDYFFFLPRILDITAADSSWWPIPEVTGRAIQSTAPLSWSHDKLEALHNFLFAVIASKIESGDYHELDSWLCAIARMDLEVQPYLQLISNNKEAVLAYFEDNAESLPRGRLKNAFWELPNNGHDAIVDWFFSPGIRRIAFEVYGCVIERST